MLKSDLPEIALKLPAAVDAACRKVAGDIASAARDRAPVASGRLRDSIRVERGDEGWAVEVGAFYGHMVEFGTAHTSPRPFLTPAVEENRAQAVATIGAAIRGVT